MFNFLKKKKSDVIPAPQPQMVQYDPQKARRKICICGAGYFHQVFEVSIISSLDSPTGQELILKREFFMCTNCKKILKG